MNKIAVHIYKCMYANYHRLHTYIRCYHCVKSVCIRSYSGQHFPAFGLNTERYFISHHVQSECGKMRTRIALNTDTSHAVYLECKKGKIYNLMNAQVKRGKTCGLVKTKSRKQYIIEKPDILDACIT